MKLCRPVLLCAVALVLGLAIFAAPGASAGVLDGLLHRVESFASPGPLSRVHASLDNAESCAKCHTQDRGLSRQLCLDCHKDVAQRIATKTGVHGQFTQDCQTCHVEHKGRGQALIDLDTARFDHSRAQFKLTGRHTELRCGACHATKGKDATVRPRRFIGLPMRCEQCHQTPHKAEFTDRCERCHTTAGWKEARKTFDHDSVAAFKLTGVHKQVDCAACHKTMNVFNDVSPQCATCHTDPHKGQFGAKACSVCHQPAGFGIKQLLFDHNRDATFELTGRHTQLRCDQCHQQGRFKLEKSSCAQCHTDPHRAALGQDCTKCHTTAGFARAALTFDHARQTGFALVGVHARLACASCHADKTFRAKGTTCAACHTDPHKGALGVTCSRCHTPAGFDASHSLFNHDRQTSFTLTGLHARAACSQCHADRTFRVKGTTCATCHADVQNFFAGRSPAPGVKAAPDAMFGQVSCRQCHVPSDPDARLATVEPRCLACHTERYARFLEQATAVTRQRALALARGSDPERARLAREVDRLAAHNFPLAQATLDALGADAATSPAQAAP